jgi:hypothetical protein
LVARQWTIKQREFYWIGIPFGYGELGKAFLARARAIVRSLELENVPDVEALLALVAYGAGEPVGSVTALFALVVLAVWDSLYLDEVLHFDSGLKYVCEYFFK